MKRTHTLFYWLLAFLPLLITALVYPVFPQTIPAHFNAQGAVDRYGDKIELFLLPVCLPLLALLFEKLFSWALKLSNTEKNGSGDPARNAKIITVSKISVILLFNLINYCLLFATYKAAGSIGGGAFDLYRIVAIILSVGDIILGNLLPKCKPNPVIGIRTPWTLKSEEVWTKTHRIGGPLLIAGGLATLAAAMFLQGMYSLIAVLVQTLLVCGFLCAYSWYLWKNLANPKG